MNVPRRVRLPRARRAGVLVAFAAVAGLASPLAGQESVDPAPALEPTVEVPDPGAEPNPTPYLVTGGRAVVEVETGSPVDRSGRGWQPSALDGSVGAAMQAAPEGGRAISWTDASTASPELSVPIRFPGPGVYFAWVRAYAPNVAGDSLHLGLDGEVQALSGYLTTRVLHRWNWFRTRINHPPARVVVPAAGIHHLMIWMREDGIHVDRIILTTDPSFAPEGLGPPESPREDEGDDGGTPAPTP